MQHLQSPEIPGFWSLLTWCSGQLVYPSKHPTGRRPRHWKSHSKGESPAESQVRQLQRLSIKSGVLTPPTSGFQWLVKLNLGYSPEAAPQIFREPPIKNVSFPLGSGIDLHRNTGISIRVSNWFTLGSFPMGHQHVPGRSRSSPAGRSAFPGTGYSAVLGTSGLPGQSCPWARRDERWGRRDDQNGPWMVVPPPSHAEERGNYQATDPTDLQHSL